MYYIASFDDCVLDQASLVHCYFFVAWNPGVVILWNGLPWYRLLRRSGSIFVAAPLLQRLFRPRFWPRNLA
jgi:hypothetical protein